VVPLQRAGVLLAVIEPHTDSLLKTIFAEGKMKFVEQPLEKLKAVPVDQLRELAKLMETRFPGGAVACNAELENRENPPGNSARPCLLLVTGADRASEMRGLLEIGGYFEGRSAKAVAAVEEMLLATRVGTVENDDYRAFLALQMGLAF
jgi:hypothetical protein